MLGPEEIIFKEKEIVDTLYILTKGSVEINMPCNFKNSNFCNKVIYTKQKGDLIGEI